MGDGVRHFFKKMEYVGIGERIKTSLTNSADSVIGGHGTQYIGTELYSTVSGSVERLNKLISVRPVRSRYAGDIGDVIVGRITSVEDKKWKVDVNSSKDAVLLLSSVNLPGGVQRRKTQADELQMRSFFHEDDLISAEVQKIHRGDGLIHLHTRSTKYGKLKYGSFVQVNQSLVKRCRQHFIDLDCGIFMILGNNGYIWITTSELKPKVKGEEEDEEMDEKKPEEKFSISAEDREKIARVRNCILALDKVHYDIWPGTIQAVYEESLLIGVRSSEILNTQVIYRVTQPALGVHRDADE